MQWTRSLAVVGLGTLALHGTAAAGADAARCAAARLKAASGKLAAKVRCHTRALARGTSVDPACLASAETRFDAAFARAGARGGCLAAGDAAAIEAIVDGALASLLASLPATTTTTVTTSATTSTEPTTSVTSTSNTSTSSTISPSCGDGVRDPGEECDGGNLCQGNCTLSTHAPGCCKGGSVACHPGGEFSLAFYMDQYCMAFFGQNAIPGSLCESDGTCQIETIQAVPLCCRHFDGTCNFQSPPATNTSGLWHFVNNCEGMTVGNTIVGATCTNSGVCQPG